MPSVEKVAVPCKGLLINYPHTKKLQWLLDTIKRKSLEYPGMARKKRNVVLEIGS
jgi:hypothetical protein